jgi:hypothetical protein
MPSNILASSLRLMGENLSPGRGRPIEQRKESIQVLMRQLKLKYPAEKAQNKIGRAKSEDFMPSSDQNARK